MNDYIRRAAKFILYLAFIFILVLFILPMISKGKMPSISFNELLNNQKFVLFFGFLLAYSLIYPAVAFTKVKRHLNGSFNENRAIFEKVFETLQYIKTDETPERTVYRRKSQFSRFIQWYEDGIVIHTNENPVIISGLRKSVVRIDRMVDQLLIKASE
jgi:hypothetical protein